MGTLRSIEGGNFGHLSILENVAQHLNATLYLVPMGREASFVSRVAFSSAYDSWATPRDIFDKIAFVSGKGIFLDPCSPGRGKTLVRAAMYYTEKDDGLSQRWAGNVYMNPPYGRVIPRWTAKARQEIENGNALAIFGLLPARTDTRWWHKDIARVADVWLLKGRLFFDDGENAAPFPSAVVIWGCTQKHRRKMAKAFEDAMHIPLPRPDEEWDDDEILEDAQAAD